MPQGNGLLRSYQDMKHTDLLEIKNYLSEIATALDLFSS